MCGVGWAGDEVKLGEWVGGIGWDRMGQDGGREGR